MIDPVAGARRRDPRLVLAMLLLVYTFNFLDRQILGILAGLIKKDLSLSDTQLGLLGGVPFAILYSTLAVPLALLADRTSRSRVIAGAMVVWSGFTALCGAVTGFWALFWCRLGVGAGEAGGVAPSYALIAAYFPPARRARALAIYSLGIPVGSAIGVLLGAWIAGHVSWRAAFYTVGVAGIAIAPVFLWLVKEPPRAAAIGGGAAPIGTVFSILARKPSFWLMAFAASMSSMGGYGLAFWAPQVIARSYRFRPAAHLLLLRVAAAGGRHAWRVPGRRVGRPARPARPGQLRQAAGGRLGDHRPPLHPRLPGPRSHGRVAAAVRSQRAQHPVAGAAGHRRPAPRPAPHAGHRLGELPVHQQPDRPRRRVGVHGAGCRTC